MSRQPDTAPDWNTELIARYDLSGPRYTSYPTAPQFHEGIGEQQVMEALERGNRARRPLSLYVHIPFCSTVCYYCGCNRIVTANRQRAAPYLERVIHEMELYAGRLDARRQVEQLHWGGGTPTYISDGEKTRLMAATDRLFSLCGDDRGEYSIEIHPGETTAASLDCLRSLGFNRLSMGIQDFDPAVQQAVNRFNSESQVGELVERARALAFHSIGFDLIYGLPRQTRASFAATVERVIRLAPDRLSVFNYAHMPELFKTQRQIDARELPDPSEKLAMLHDTIDRLLDAGYVYIGMDHFARPEDALAKAQQEGRLQRNFQGYATHGHCDLVAMGVSAISAIDDLYVQNHKALPAYQQSLDGGRLPVWRGVRRSADDHIRAAVIGELICHFHLSFTLIEARFGIRFREYFAPELERLTPMVHDGLVVVEDDGLRVAPAGRLLIRRLCMVFDAYLNRDAGAARYSRIL